MRRFSYFCTMLKKILALASLIFLFSCGEDYLPKPKGQLRLEYPKPNYANYKGDCGFSFQYSDFARLEPAQKPCWYNLRYPAMKANVHMTYYPVKGDYLLHLKETERMVYEHTVKASAIETKSFSYPEKRVFGNFYELKGQSASNVQFYITDSARHFVTGNLYFNSRPKPDSLAPAVDYIKKDILHLIETFEWKN